MKKISYIVVAAGVTAMASCSIEENKIDQPAAAGQKITLCGETYSQTKVSIGEKDGSVYPLLWQEGDAISIWSKSPVADADTIKGEQATLYADDAGKASGVFQTNNEVVPSKGEDILILYPASKMSYNYKGVVSMTLDDSQEQRKANSSDHVGNYSFAVAQTSLAKDQTEDVKFTLSQKTAYVKLELSTTEFSSLNLVGAKLYCAGSELSGKIKYNANDGTIAYSDTKNYVNVSLRTPVAFSGKQELYFTTLPCDLTGKDVYVIITMSDDTKTVTIPAKVNGGQLKASALTVITIDNISTATNEFKWYEPVETRYIAAYGEGWSYGPQNCFVSYFDDENAVTFDVKARGNFSRCVEPSYVVVYNACEANVKNKTNLIINGENAYNGTEYIKIAVNSDYTISVKANKAGSYTGYSSKVKLFDKNDNCIWAFNIWGNQEKLVEQTYKNGVVLDRNIGADSSKGYGYMAGSYYQWGRPFQTGWSSSGGLFTGASTIVTDLAISAAHPEIFYHMKDVNPSQGGDWYLGAHTGARSEHIDDLWGNPNTTGDQVVDTDGKKSIYDPCPEGYMVVSPKILKEIFDAAPKPAIEVVNSGSNYYESDGKTKFSGSQYLEYTLPDGSVAKWPFSGCKWGSNGGNCDNNNCDICSCWGNAPVTSYEQNGANAYVMYYRYKEGAWPALSKQNGNRAHGYSVRCMKEPNK